MTDIVTAPAQAADDAPEPPAIEVDNVSLNYRVRLDAGSALADVKRLVTRKRDHNRVVRAVKHASFNVEQGTTMAIVGRNGAGKSTILRALAGILPPNEGRIVVRGRVNLLALGLGMNPQLTGRDNILLGGLAVGLSRDRIDELTEEIADLAALGEYLDFPMNAYSSGMRSRLAFSVAVHLDPEILLIDEALGGGDSGFANAAREKMAELCGEGRTIVLVTHGLSAVRSMATHALWLHQGEVVEVGDPEDIITSYMRFCRIEELDNLPDDL